MIVSRRYVNLFYILSSMLKLAVWAWLNCSSTSGVIENTWLGVPAAAQIFSNAKRRGSIKTFIGRMCPIGDTPPMAKPVCSRIKAASALPKGSWASEAAFV